MRACTRCGGVTALGTLCELHAQELATCTDITAEQLVVQSEDKPVAWLIDQWGFAHPLGELTTVGRDQKQCEVAVLHASVSTLHAQIECGQDSLARISDRGSLNGTLVNGDPVGRTRLFDGDVLRIGDVSFFFALSALSPLSPSDGVQGSGRTVPSRAEDLSWTVRIQVASRELCLVETLTGGVGSTEDSEIIFAALEFSLLKALIARQRQAPSAGAAYMSGKELAETLAFQSSIADSDNVRELVRRVRKKLKRVGLQDVIQSRQGAGYRLGWPAKSR